MPPTCPTPALKVKAFWPGSCVLQNFLRPLVSIPVQCTVTDAPRVTAGPFPCWMIVFVTPGETWIASAMTSLNFRLTLALVQCQKQISNQREMLLTYTGISIIIPQLMTIDGKKK